MAKVATIDVTAIDDLLDARLQPYHNLKNRNPTGLSGSFIVESKLLVQRLIDSDYEVESIMIDSHLSDIPPSWLERNVPIYRIAEATPLLGFHFHRGAMACGKRRPLSNAETIFESRTTSSSKSDIALYLHQIQDPENMGLVLRCCAALSVNDIIIGPSCVDPYARRVVRVSMGNVLKLNLLRDHNPLEFIARLRQQNMESIATTLEEKANSLRDFRVERPCVLFVGNEANGLPPNLTRACSQRLSIPMQTGVDSLNVSHAAAIFLYQLTSSRFKSKLD